MEQISTLLQGGYAYLLIFQILVVSSLFVMLVLMVVRRMKVEVLAPSLALPDVALAGPQVSLEEHAKLQAKLDALEIDLQRIEKLKADNAALTEKVKFLEPTDCRDQHTVLDRPNHRNYRVEF